MSHEAWSKVETTWASDFEDPLAHKLPWWWSNTNRPCEHSGEGRVIKHHVGYSDFAYFQLQCQVCAHTWCVAMEG